MPRIASFDPQIGLQIQPDGRRTWALSRDTSDTSATPKISDLKVDQGTLKYRAADRGADMLVLFILDAGPVISQQSTAQLPLGFKASGKWNDESFTATGRTGGVLKLSRDLTESFPMEVSAQSGRTTSKASGTVENWQEFSGLNAAIDIQGRNLDELYKLAGVVLPSTPPYKLSGQLRKRGQVLSTTQIQGMLGKSDITGDMSFDTSQKTTLLTGRMRSKNSRFR